MTSSTIENQIGDVREQIGELRGELRGEVNGLNLRMDDMHRRMDDMHRLMMVMIGVAAGGLVSGVIGVILQLVK